MNMKTAKDKHTIRDGVIERKCGTKGYRKGILDCGLFTLSLLMPAILGILEVVHLTGTIAIVTNNYVKIVSTIYHWWLLLVCFCCGRVTLAAILRQTKFINLFTIYIGIGVFHISVAHTGLLPTTNVFSFQILLILCMFIHAVFMGNAIKSEPAKLEIDTAEPKNFMIDSTQGYRKK